MRDDSQERAVALGQYIAESGATVRCAAKKFGISKSTVHTVVAKPKGCKGAFFFPFFETDSKNRFSHTFLSTFLSYSKQMNNYQNTA
ncbi:MAG: sporulation transcriptional regulator SpoIIID [Clostridia bacterium]|nr:sporulation transcriptional regulator SpoIIID [Clostridia bacterium]